MKIQKKILMKRTKQPKLQRTKPVKRSNRPSKYKIPGRKGIYDEGVPKRAHELAKLGLRNQDLAIAFGCNVTTIELWLKDKPEFRDAVDAGKAIFDTGVQETLLQRALGYEYDEVSHRTGIDSQDRKYSYTTKTTKRVLPDVTAIIFWLKNRHKEQWADVHKTEVSAQIDYTKNLRIETLTPEEQKLVKSIAIKNLKGIEGVSNN